MLETMIVRRGYQYKACPTVEQEHKFKQTIGCARLTYNELLARRNENYKQTGKHKIFTPAILKSEFSFLRDVDSLALNSEYNFLKKAFNSYFKNSSYFEEPKFHSKKKDKQSYITSVVNNNIRLDGNMLRLPKVGWVKLKLHRNPPSDSRLKSVTVTHFPDGKWIVSILFEYEIQVNKLDVTSIPDEKIIGLDYANRELYVDNNGKKPKFLKPYRNSLNKLQREQRKLSRMEKGSNNYEKQRVKVATIHGHIANQRKQFHHDKANELNMIVFVLKILICTRWLNDMVNLFTIMVGVSLSIF